MRTLPGLLLLLLVVSPSVGPAQQSMPTEAVAIKTADIIQARQRNAALMKTYTWNERVELLKNDTIKDTRVNLVTYLPDGQLQKTLLSDQHDPPPRGFFRRRIAQGEVNDVKGYLEGLHQLIDQYTLPNGGAVFNFLSTAMVSRPGPDGNVTVSGTGVVVPGDLLTIWIKGATKQTARVFVSTTYQGSAVELNATFRTLPTGLTYNNYATVDLPSKQLELLVQNFDYVAN
jgi:hypothetical protein